MPGEDTLNNLISAGPITAVAIAFVLVAIALIILAIAVWSGVKAFINIHTQTNKQLRLTRRAVVKSSEASAKGLSDVAKVAGEIREEAKARHEELKTRVTAAETSITNLEGSTSDILKPLVQKVDSLIATVEALRGSTVNKVDIENFVASIRAGLGELEVHIVEKFGALVTSNVTTTVTVETPPGEKEAPHD
jgi:hypothetical protein